MTIYTSHVRDSSEDDLPRERVFNKIVHHGGRNFLATEVMAAIFAARAEDVIARSETELVPLLHKNGVDLLLVGPHTVFAVVNIGTGIGAGRPAQSGRAAS